MKRLMFFFITSIFLASCDKNQEIVFDKESYYSLSSSDLKFMSFYWSDVNNREFDKLEIATKNDKRNEYWLSASKRIRFEEDKVFKLIDSLQSRLIIEFRNLNISVNELSEIESIKISNKILNIEGNALLIKSEINKLKELMKEYANHMGPGMIDNELLSILNTNSFKDGQNFIPWENEYFKNIPIGPTITNLEMIKLKILMAENVVLRFFNGNTIK